MKFVYHAGCLDHVQWPGHPERPERVKAIVDRLEGETPARTFQTPRRARLRDLTRVHEDTFVERMRGAAEGPYDADTFVHKETFGLALLSAGAALEAARVALGTGEEAFALARPPGHHAGSSFAGGFCYFNNVAIAADFLARDKKRAPVAIVDIDVHHGNGTQQIFEERDDIVYLSTHQWGIFPGTGKAGEVGKGAGRGRVVNVPLPPGSGDATFKLAWERLLLPVLRAARPRAVVVSLGLDAHYDDPLAGLTLSSSAYIDVCARIAAFAREEAGAPAVFVLEGGYSLAALSETVAGIAAAVEGRPFSTGLNTVHDASGVGRAAVERAVGAQRAFWDLGPAPRGRGRRRAVK